VIFIPVSERNLAVTYKTPWKESAINPERSS
jgi:hypothetical protein